VKALAVTPLVKNSLRLIDHSLKETDVIVKVLETGVCRTDKEIIMGLYGEAPPDSNYLIIGHECLGVVVRGSKILKEGDYVVRMVRRPCYDNRCDNCLEGNQDMCSSGNYTEAGIKGVHGGMAEYFTDTEDNLIYIPKEHSGVGVLLEPLSVVEKATYQVGRIQERLSWNPKRALVIGAGSIGLLEAMLLRLNDMDVFVMARSPSGNKKSQIVEAIDAHYISTEETSFEAFLRTKIKFDFIYEASGNAKIIPLLWAALANNGVLSLSSITGGNEEINFPIERLNLQAVLGNKLIFGAVNSNKSDYKTGVKNFMKIKNTWPGILEKMLTRRVSIDNYTRAFETSSEDIKTVIEF